MPSRRLNPHRALRSSAVTQIATTVHWAHLIEVLRSPLMRAVGIPAERAIKGGSLPWSLSFKVAVQRPPKPAVDRGGRGEVCTCSKTTACLPNFFRSRAVVDLMLHITAVTEEVYSQKQCPT